jgi:acetylornithine deacetylase
MASGLPDRILATAARERDASLAFLRDLIRAGRKGETAILAHVERAVAEIGCTVESHAYEPASVPMVGEFAGVTAMNGERRISLLARLPRRGRGRSLIFFAHPDSEPVADTESWRQDPFGGGVVDGRVYGWGVADDLAGIAMMVEGLRLFAASGPPNHGEVILAATPSKRHARGVSALLRGGVTADAAVYLHPAESGAGMGEVKAFSSGQLEFRVVVVGNPPPTTEPLQTAFAHLAVNPVDKAMYILREFGEFAAVRAARIYDPLLDAEVGRSTNLMTSYMAAGDASRLAVCPRPARLASRWRSHPPNVSTMLEMRSKQS